ncbi:MAG: proline racemase family protein [Geminicoccaceae bacterium]|nr:proline racemase family protein [Geminicoccaceae bacterium]
MRLSLLNVHAAGEIGRVILDGAPAVPGASVADKLRYLNEVDDGLRRFCTNEPNGFCQMSTNLLLPPIESGTDAGFIVLQPDAAHAMSGSNAICVTTALLETGRVAMREPETVVRLDTAAGIVEARARCEGGRARSVRLAMPWSFAEALDAEIEAAGLGRVRVDLAFGGVFYALVDPAPLGLEIRPEAAGRLARVGMRILDAVRARHRPVHPERPGIRGVAYLMFRGQDGHNATVMPPGRIDRSPCGTGSSARLAAAHARGEVGAGYEAAFRSILGTRFGARILAEGRVAGRPAVRPEIEGEGTVYGREDLWLDPPENARPSDCWGDCWGDCRGDCRGVAADDPAAT